LPPFIHCAHDSLQPPLATPDQLRDSGAAAAQEPVAGIPNCWKIGAGEDEEVEPDDAPPPPPPPPPDVTVIVDRVSEEESLNVRVLTVPTGRL
jgi:hypothetical protein